MQNVDTKNGHTERVGERDVRVERRAVKREAESRAFLQSALDALKANICILDAQGVILAVNAAWRRFGESGGWDDPQAGVGQNYLQVCDLAACAGVPDAGTVAGGIRAVMGGRDEFYLEYPCHTPTERRWFGVRVTPFSGDDAQNGPRRVVVAHENISARLEAQTELQTSEARYRVLADTVPAFVFAMDASGVTYANRQWFDYCGQTLEQSLGFGWVDTLHPDDHERVLGHLGTALEKGELFRDEYRLRRYDGAYRWHLIVTQPLLEEDGRISRWFGTGTDIHERYEAEQRAALLAKVGETLSSTLDPERALGDLARLCVPELADWCAVHVLEGETLRLVTVAHADANREQQAREMAERYPPRRDLPDGLYHVLKTRRAVQVDVPPSFLERVAHDEMHLQELRALDLSCLILAPLEARGQAFGVLSLNVGREREFGSTDLAFATQLARAAGLYIDNARLFAESERARRELEAAARAKDEFLAVVSHELRTPLTPILGWVQMLRADEEANDFERMDSEMRLDALASMERNAVAQSQLVNDLLDVSRITTGKMRLQLRPLDLRDVLRDALPALRPTALARDIELREEFESCAIMGDPDRLQQVVWNLVSNALKFTPHGGRVEVRATCDAQTATVEVRDTGRGIDPAFLPFVFDRFRQEDSSSTRSHGGLGLGLSIVRHIVEGHGGSVEALSDGEGRGATFRVHLPCLSKSE